MYIINVLVWVNLPFATTIIYDDLCHKSLNPLIKDFIFITCHWCYLVFITTATFSYLFPFYVSGVTSQFDTNFEALRLWVNERSGFFLAACIFKKLFFITFHLKSSDTSATCQQNGFNSFVYMMMGCLLWPRYTTNK